MSHRKLVQPLLGWFARDARDLPWRRTLDPYAIWVSEIMLQQTQVKTVVPYWERWMRAVPNATALAHARPEKLHKLWEGLGYYTRVRNMQKAARLIVAEHGGRFPVVFEDILALPGIGRYTAGAICSIAFNQARPILDGNVIRVLTRLFGIGGNPREKETNGRLWLLSEAMVQEAARLDGRPRSTPHPATAEGRQTLSRASGLRHSTAGACSCFNQSLMELGALVCTPRRPRCGACPVAKCCTAHTQGRMHEFPEPARRPRVTARRFVAFVVEERGRFLVRRRPAGVVNAHLWEFPNHELRKDERDAKGRARAEFGGTGRALELLCTIRHSITRYRITLEVFRVSGAQPCGAIRGKGQWLNLAQLQRLPFASAHKRILDRLRTEARRR
jgi:A/G-specific adenine glycosylase